MPGTKYFRYFNYSPGGEPPPDYPNPPSPDPPSNPDPPGSNCCIKAICVTNENDIGRFDSDGNLINCCTPIKMSDIPGFQQGDLQVLSHVQGDSCLKWISVVKCEE